MYGRIWRLLLKDALIADQEVPDGTVEEIAETFSLVSGIFLSFYQWRKDFLYSLSPWNIAILQ